VELPLGRTFDIDVADVVAAIPLSTMVSIRIYYRLNADDVPTVVLNLPPRKLSDYNTGGTSVPLLTYRPTMVGYYQATLTGLLVVSTPHSGGGAPDLEANAFEYRAKAIYVRCQAGP
jgi:hypothetical protein